jgi:hypothetical protein
MNKLSVSIPPEIVNYIFTFIQSNVNQIVKNHIYDVTQHKLNKDESNLYYFLCMRKCKYNCSLCNETDIPNTFKLYSIYDNRLEFFKYSPYEIIFCSEECLDLWWNY